MAPLAHQRCQNHADREAVARCPECHRHFCRECISEHDERILCATCLALQTAPPVPRKRQFQGAILLVQSALAFLAIWFFFYLVASALLSIPASFHEGTIWNTFFLSPE